MQPKRLIQYNYHYEYNTVFRVKCYEIYYNVDVILKMVNPEISQNSEKASYLRMIKKSSERTAMKILYMRISYGRVRGSGHNARTGK